MNVNLTDKADSLGIVESRTIARGAIVTDVMMKAADVELLRAAPICSGRFLVYVAGNRSSVSTAVSEANAFTDRLMDSVVISNVSPLVMAVLRPGRIAAEGRSVGIVEAKTVTAGIHAADSAVKQGAVDLVKLVTGQGINGKSYFVVSGEVASVHEAVDAAVNALGRRLIDHCVMPNPELSVRRKLVG